MVWGGGDGWGGVMVWEVIVWGGGDGVGRR